MDCPDCDGETAVAAVPEPVRPHVPENADRVAICSTCLSLSPTDEAVPDSSDVSALSDAMPADSEATVGVVVLVNLLESLAHNRAAIESLVGWLERRGVDVFLVLDRLAADPELEPDVDLERRLPQVEQFVG